MRQLSLACVLVFSLACDRTATTYPLVLHGGRVMDPATGLDSVRDVAISDGKIIAISAGTLRGKDIVDVTGKVVAPGFIDLNAHGQTTGDMQIQVRDGVTTALDMESGVLPVAAWYASMDGKATVNYGATVSHRGARVAVFHGVELGHMPTNPRGLVALGPTPDGTNKAASAIQSTRWPCCCARGWTKAR